MLASVLHSEVAINVSIGIMRAFVEMRRFIANNALLFERISNVELKQLEYQKKTDEKLEQIFEYISDHEESNQKIFFDGQIYDAFRLLIGLIQKAETEIVLVDGYVDVGTLNILSKKKENVAVTVYTQQRTKLSQTDVDNFNAQYPKLDVKYTRAFHDLSLNNCCVPHRFHQHTNMTCRYNNGFPLLGAGIQYRWEQLFHAYWRAAAMDIAGQRQKILLFQHFDSLDSNSLGSFFEVQLFTGGNPEHKIFTGCIRCHQRFENHSRRKPQIICCFPPIRRKFS